MKFVFEFQYICVFIHKYASLENFAYYGYYYQPADGTTHNHEVTYTQRNIYGCQEVMQDNDEKKKYFECLCATNLPRVLI